MRHPHKRKRLTQKDRAKKKADNERRGRTELKRMGNRWEREHVKRSGKRWTVSVKEPVSPGKRLDGVKLTERQAANAMTEAALGLVDKFDKRSGRNS